MAERLDAGSLAAPDYFFGAAGALGLSLDFGSELSLTFCWEIS